MKLPCGHDSEALDPNCGGSCRAWATNPGYRRAIAKRLTGSADNAPPLDPSAPAVKRHNLPGVGGQLKEIFQRLAIEKPAGCGCYEVERDMDTYGPGACETLIDQLALRLKTNAEKFQYADKIKAKAAVRKNSTLGEKLRLGIAWTAGGELRVYKTFIRWAIRQYRRKYATLLAEEETTARGRDGAGTPAGVNP